MAGYTPTGPFTNGSAPGISAAFLNNVENWIQQLEGDSGAVTQAGGTSGSVTLYETLQGTFKIVFIYYNNYKDAGTHNITLPVAFTSGGILITGGIGTATGGNDGGLTLRIGAADQTLQQFTGFSAGAAGSTANETIAYAYNIYQFQNAAIDTIHLALCSNAAHTGPAFIIGI